MLETLCRLCGKKGNWKAECPDRPRASTANASASAPTMMAIPSEAASGHADEFLPLPEIHEATLDEPRPHSVFATVVHLRILRGKRYNIMGNNGVMMNHKNRLSRSFHIPGKTPDVRSDAPSLKPTCLPEVSLSLVSQLPRQHCSPRMRLMAFLTRVPQSP